MTYDATEAQLRRDILQSIIDIYYPNGEPLGSENQDVCCILDTMNISMVNEEVVVTGGVEPYDISIDITGNVQTVTVIDFDGCESTLQNTINNLTEEHIEGLKIYPNPASSEIYIDLSESNHRIERLKIVSINGQILNYHLKTDRVIDISSLNEGMYILQIELDNGVRINKRVLVLR